MKRTQNFLKSLHLRSFDVRQSHIKTVKKLANYVAKV